MSLFDNGPVLLDSPEKMLAVLRELAGDDALTWRGVIDVWGEQNPEPQPARWRLQLNNDHADEPGGRVIAYVGDYLALAYGRLLKLTEEEATG